MRQFRVTPQTNVADNFKKIHYNIMKSDRSDYVKNRQLVITVIVSVAIVRFTELTCLTIDCIVNSAHKNMIKIPTDKYSNCKFKYRLITFPNYCTHILQRFIEIDRRRIVLSTIGDKNDIGELLLSEQTGQKLSLKYLSKDIIDIALAAGIEVKISTNKLCQQNIYLLINKLHNHINGKREYDLSETDLIWLMHMSGARMLEYYINSSTGVDK